MAVDVACVSATAATVSWHWSHWWLNDPTPPGTSVTYCWTSQLKQLSLWLSLSM